MNWWLIAARAQGPAVLMVILAVVVAEVFDRIAGLGARPDGTLTAISIYLPLVAAAVAVLWWLAVVARLKAWEAGRVADCRHCSGPLGMSVRPGKRMYGRQLADFYRCWNCGKATPAE